MIARSLFLACALSFASVHAASADPVDDLVRKYMDVSHIPGAAVAVIEKGQVKKLAGYGVANLEWDGKATPDTPFQIASATKIFTGVILMRLVERGEIKLDTPITDLLPNAPDSWRKITVRQLANHSSGLPEGLSLPVQATPQDTVAAAMAKPLAYEPGSESRYGLTDFVVLTAILEKVSGLSFPDLLAREISKPLGLANTGFIMQTEGGPVRSALIMPGRSRVYGWRNGVQRDEEFIYPIRTYSAGGLYSSVRDLATVFTAIEDHRLLSAESFKILTTAVPLTDGRTGAFGVGWTFGVYRGEPVVGHTGGPALADVMYVPSRGLTIVALTNQRRFFALLSQSIADLEMPAPKPRAAVVDKNPQLTALVRKSLTDATVGQMDLKAFDTEKAKDSVGFLSDFGQGLLIAVGPIQSLDLLSDKKAEDGATRRSYRIRFERREMVWVVRSLPDGRLIELRPGGEND